MISELSVLSVSAGFFHAHSSNLNVEAICFSETSLSELNDATTQQTVPYLTRFHFQNIRTKITRPEIMFNAQNFFSVRLTSQGMT
jgi:hypothetical protein